MSSRIRHSLGPKISFFAFQDIITSVSGILILVVLLLGTYLDSVSNDTPQTKWESNKILENKLKALQQEVAELVKTLDDSRISLNTLDPDAVKRKIGILSNSITVLNDKMASLNLNNQEKNKLRVEQIGKAGLTAEAERVKEIGASNEQKKNRSEVLRQEHDWIVLKVRQSASKVAVSQADKNKIWLHPDNKPSTKAPIIVFLGAPENKAWEFDSPKNQIILPNNENEILVKFEKFLKKYDKHGTCVVIYVQPDAVSLFKKIREFAQEKAGYDVGWDALEEGIIIQPGAPPKYRLEEPDVISSLPKI
jgi:hypothetical protein